ncbi:MULTISPECIES: response regulator receiver domain [Shewanella]|uniref:response regulator receiver domain n=1 Tax=Shewanella TaxID=22 RepID=UPI00201ADD1F|nr:MULTISPECIES: response regulator receiver domain [Shewanella]
MTDQTLTQPQVTYKDLIKEAFIAPVRNVTVIDDEYPTLLGFLEQQITQDNPGTLKPKQLNHTNIERLKRILNMCHDTHKWSVDVYDGQSPKLGALPDFPEHLNQSDLLILDYHLDDSPEIDDGKRARKIVEHLVKNNHFNLVIIHTKGHEDDISKVFEQVLKDLYKPHFLPSYNPESIETIEAWMDNQESERASRFLELKISFLDIACFLNLNSNSTLYKFYEKEHIFNPFKEDIEYISKKTGISTENIIAWKINDILGAIKDGITADIQWSFNKKINFISTGKAFITVVKKSDEEPVELLHEKLTEALIAHNPPPIMLLLAKIRHELDEKGLEQASDIINDQLAQSGWLIDMYNSHHDDDFKHLGAISRHWEQLSAASKEPLIEFSKRMYSAIRSETVDKYAATRLFFPKYLNNELNQIKHLNAYICSYPINGSHINTGTVFELEDGDEKQFWVCLSPACDLVPNQAKKRWETRLGQKHSAFQAVKLFEVTISNDDRPKNIEKFQKSINQNEHVFIRYNDGIKTFRFTENDISNPVWETFYALNHGNYFEGNILKLQHLRPVLTEPNDHESDPIPQLKLSDVKDVKAIASLRYEYGLNLLQKLGGNQSRVGLDFISSL